MKTGAESVVAPSRRVARLALAAAAALLVLCGLYTFAEFRIESSADSLVLAGDPDLRFYQETRTVFASDEFVLCALEGPDHFTRAGVERLERLASELEALPGIAQVLAPTRVPLFRSRRRSEDESGLRAAFLDRVPRYLNDPQVDLERARDELREHRLYRYSVVSADGRVAAVLAFLSADPELLRTAARRAELQGLLEAPADPSAADAARRDLAELEPRYQQLERERKDQRFAAVDRVRAVLARAAAEGVEVHASGVPVVVVEIIAALRSDLLWMNGASLLFLAAFLLVVARSWRYTLLALFVVLLSVAATLALFFATGRTLTIVSANAPSLLGVLALAHALHLRRRQRELLARHPDLEPPAAMRLAARALWRPCFWTVATTTAGFASLTLAGIRPVEDYGLATSVGIFLAFALSFALLPLGAQAFPEARGAVPAPSRPRSLGRLGRLAQRRGGVLAIGAGLLACGAALGVPHVEVETRFLDYFGKHTALYRDFEYLDRRMGGTMNLELILDADDPAVFESDAGLAQLGELDAWLSARPEMGSVTSLHDFVVEIGNVLPGSGGLEPTLALLRRFLGEEKIRLYRSDDGRRQRILGRVHESRSELDRRGLLRALRAELERRRPQLEALGIRVRPTGMFLLYTNVLDSLVGSQIETAAATVLGVLGMLALALRSLRAGVLGLVPNALTILVVLGVMGWVGIHLDVATVMVTSISFGIAVDATIHYLHRVRRERLAGRGPHSALLRAHRTIGVSILQASETAVVAFSVYALSNFRPNVVFGMLTALAMAVAFLATASLVPFLVLRLRPFGRDAGVRPGA